MKALAAHPLLDALERAPRLRGPALESRGRSQTRPVLVSFFASWRERGVVVVGVNVFESFGNLSSPERLEAFLDQTGLSFPIVGGDEAMRQTFGGIDRAPTVVMLRRDGSESERFVHERNATKTHLEADEVEAMIARAV